MIRDTDRLPLLRTRPGRTQPTPLVWYPDPERTDLERSIQFRPGFGLDPTEATKPNSQRFGRSAMEIVFFLRGPKGIGQFVMSTGWTPEANHPDPRWANLVEWMHHGPTAFDLGYHARWPQYPGAVQYGEQPCDFLGAPCWYDGSGLQADDVLLEFFDRGESAVWEALTRVHDELTEGEPT